MFQRFYILKGIKIPVLAQKLRQFCWMGGFGLLVEGKGLRLQSAQQACLGREYKNTFFFIKEMYIS